MPDPQLQSTIWQIPLKAFNTDPHKYNGKPCKM